MSAWQRGKMFWGRVRDQFGAERRVSLQTADRRTADQIEAVLSALRDQRDWQLVNAVAQGTLQVGELWDAWRTRDLDSVRRRLTDVDVSLHLDRWQHWAVRNGASPGTVTTYARQVGWLLDKVGTQLSQLTRPALSSALLDLSSGSNARRYHAAWSSLFGYLVEAGLSPDNPLRSVVAPAGNPPKELWMELPNVLRLIDAQDEPYRSLAAFREGAGVEISAALRTRVRDINHDLRLVFAHGTKTSSRDRWVRVDDWAWPRVLAAATGKLPDALLWDVAPEATDDARRVKLGSERAYRHHRRALAFTALQDLPQKYTLHDARHSYAVRHVKLGTPYRKIAHNLGHTDETQVIKCYGKHRLTESEISYQTPERIAQ